MAAGNPSTGTEVREFVIREKGVWKSFGEEEECPTWKEIARDIDRWKNDVHNICAGGAEPQRKWRMHTQKMHVLHEAPKMLREQYWMGETSQAYCKFLEILCRYPELTHGADGELRSFHLCEAPGHFVRALDRFLAAFHTNKKFEWCANSLNPHCETTSPCDMLLDDDLLVMFPDRWFFGADGTGDITKFTEADVEAIFHKFAEKEGAFGYDLITADGSLYAQDDPASQEKIVLPLLEAEARVAMGALRKGGHFVVKMYSLFHPETRQFVIDLSKRFASVYMFKPMCSKSGNSERYLICMGYLTDFLKDNQKITFLSEVQKTLRMCEKYFSDLQGRAIEKNIETFGEISKEEVNVLRDRVMAIFRKRIHINYLTNTPRHLITAIHATRNPWKDVFGTNYVERLKGLEEPGAARQFMADQLREEMISNEDRLENVAGPVEIEYDKHELKFLLSLGPNGSTIANQSAGTVVLGQLPEEIRHSLFTRPDWLFATRQFAPEAIVDLFHPSTVGISPYAKELHTTIRNGGPEEFTVRIDAEGMRSKEDWLLTLEVLIPRLPFIKGLGIYYGDETTPVKPMILSRFSASMIAFLTILFFKSELKEGHECAFFAKANYIEDIPPATPRYLQDLQRCSTRVLQFVPMHCLSTIHADVLSFNRRQWRLIMQSFPAAPL